VTAIITTIVTVILSLAAVVVIFAVGISGELLVTALLGIVGYWIMSGVAWILGWNVPEQRRQEHQRAHRNA
jgi:hypothetical protein